MAAEVVPQVLGAAGCHCYRTFLTAVGGCDQRFWQNSYLEIFPFRKVCQKGTTYTWPWRLQFIQPMCGASEDEALVQTLLSPLKETRLVWTPAHGPVFGKHRVGDHGHLSWSRLSPGQ